MHTKAATATAPQFTQPAEGLINKGQTSDRLGVSQRTLDNWMKAGRVPYMKIGRTVRFRWETVLSALDAFNMRGIK